MKTTLHGWEMTGLKAPLQACTRQVEGLREDEVLVEVAGCGLCHTDLGFLYEGVPTRNAPPLILGHEISGIVREAGPVFEHLVGKAVVVPAVIPCGSCAACEAGRPMTCPRQVMPGNDRDGGFASHVVVPARGLCPVPGAGADMDAPLGGIEGLSLRHLAVVADAVSTPYQAICRAGLRFGDLAVVVGLGGVGGYAVRIARALGATVVGLEVDAMRRATAEQAGATLVLDPGAADPRELRRQIGGFAREVGAPPTGWTILECSGTPAGQQTAFGLLNHGATLCIVGFTPRTVEVRLSNLMAFDARAIGNWGCDPALYPEIVDLVLEGRIDVVSPTEIRPLSAIQEAFNDVLHHRVHRRLVLVP